ncbi:GTP-binding protein [Coprinopsis cinerea AmutBmut pab1-1]|nr:GTP-binding protein [Coprinopsis cinerea AmutBmut pab1-1]
MAPAKGKNHNPSGLGRAIINRKVKDAQRQQQSGLYSVDLDSNRLKSVTQERNLEEFLNTAELAGTDFTAERRNVKIINQTAPTSQNPYLLTEAEEVKLLEKQEKNKSRLQVPRRPAWTKSMKHEELDRNEKAAFLQWRRNLAQLQESENFLLTPFERNIEVWRQLWRVLERSHLVVQIVDARNPLRFRCKDLEDYVRDVEGNEGEAGSGPGKRESMLLINKADLLTAKQRLEWANYFDKEGTKYAFYSAATANAIQEARREAAAAQLAAQNRSGDESSSESEASDDEDEDDDHYFSAPEDEGEDEDPRTKILTVDELEKLFLRLAPDLHEFKDVTGKPPSKLTLGLVGYPNVGKSSTINSLLGQKKVSVSATPGKTKHFQTIHLSDSIVLCDCPGLVFPQFATTKADLVCDGVLPIDQLREHTGPVALVVKRIPKSLLEATYGLTIRTTHAEDGGDGFVKAEDFLQAYAIARGFMRSGFGNPDESRAARYILKDYVKGKLLFCHPPPGIDEDRFNEETHERRLKRYATKKKAPVTRVGKSADTYMATEEEMAAASQTLRMGQKSRAIDDEFFQSQRDRPFMAGSKGGKAFSRSILYPNQVLVADDGTPLSGAQARMQVMMQGMELGGKKHKKIRRAKQRSGKGYD